MADTKDDSEDDSETISAPEAAKLLMLGSVRRVQQLADEGYIKRLARGKYSRMDVVHGYIRFLKDTLKDRQTNTHVNRVQDARAREIEIRNAKASHELIEYTEAEAVLLEVAGMLRSEFSGFGARMTRDMPMRRKIESGVDEIFGRASARIVETLKSLREAGEVVDADSEDESG